MPTGSIRVNFDGWRRILAEYWESDLTGYRPGNRFTDGFIYATSEGDMSITFTQITQIESIRRQIESLQTLLSEHANITTFGWLRENDKWRVIDTEFAPFIKDTLCKVTVAKIVKLLDEAAKLGVDTDNERKLLLEFLQELAPKDPPA